MKVFLLIYSFKGKKPSSSFYRHAGGERILDGVLAFPSLSRASAALEIVERQGGEGAIFESCAVSPLPGTFERWERLREEKGKKRKPKSWVITCYECVDTFFAFESFPRECPKCGGLLFRVRPGFPLEVRVNPQYPIFDQWVITRFATGRFEIPKSIIETAAEVSPPSVFPDEKEVVEEVRKALEGQENNSFSALDRLFCQKIALRLLGVL